jgi:hypothetical protein
VSGEEHALGPRGPGAFPESWGTPAGRQFSEERAAWVAAHAAREQRDQPLRNTYRQQLRLLNDLRLADVARLEGVEF